MTDIQYGYCHCGCGEKTMISGSTSATKGIKKGEPNKYLRGHHIRVREGRAFYDPPPIEYTENGCWMWLGRTGRGYALSRPRFGTSSVHRQNWIEKNGPVPSGMELDHLCRNRACVNPDHLEPVTHVENVRRGGAARLTYEDAEVIRAATESVAVLAARFGISYTQCWRIRNGQRWARKAA